jgi:hypothetical protein
LLNSLALVAVVGYPLKKVSLGNRDPDNTATAFPATGQIAVNERIDLRGSEIRLSL